MTFNKIKTIRSSGEFKLKEKGSLFIAQSYIIENEDDFSNIYSLVKKKFYDATHHCYSYKYYPGKEKYSDDGEPNGTAGIRILNAINHFDLTNLTVIVIRYFGGTKLGVGPLGKAYYQSALELLKASEALEKTKYSVCRINFGYDLTSLVHHQLKEYKAREITNRFEDNPIVECYIKTELVPAFFELLKDSSKGKIDCDIINEKFLADF